MARLFVITFAVLGWAWYELSGGAAFEPGSHGVQVLAQVDETTLPERIEPAVSRAETSAAQLTSLAVTTVAEPAPVVAAPKPKLPANIVPVAAPVVDDAQPVVTPVLPSDTKVASRVDYRKVSGSRVNVRNGPSTSYQVVMQLRRGDEVEILQDPGEGWVKLRALEGSRVGWMSASFLTAAN